MAGTGRIPPGRAGRLWLQRRLATAVRGRDQLDRKLRILLREQQRWREQADAADGTWRDAYGHAQAWLLRAVLLGGQEAIRVPTAPRPAGLEISWRGSMGLRYPARAQLVAPAPEPGAAPAPNAAVGPALDAFRDAMAAGVGAAVADEAVRRIEAEIAVTRRRLRAVDRRWLPWLAGELARREFALEQAEQEDGIRLRRCAAGPGPAR